MIFKIGSLSKINPISKTKKVLGYVLRKIINFSKKLKKIFFHAVFTFHLIIGLAQPLTMISSSFQPYRNTKSESIEKLRTPCCKIIAPAFPTKKDKITLTEKRPMEPIFGLPFFVGQDFNQPDYKYYSSYVLQVSNYSTLSDSTTSALHLRGGVNLYDWLTFLTKTGYNSMLFTAIILDKCPEVGGFLITNPYTKQVIEFVTNPYTKPIIDVVTNPNVRTILLATSKRDISDPKLDIFIDMLNITIGHTQTLRKIYHAIELGLTANSKKELHINYMEKVCELLECPLVRVFRMIFHGEEVILFMDTKTNNTVMIDANSRRFKSSWVVTDKQYTHIEKVGKEVKYTDEIKKQ